MKKALLVLVALGVGVAGGFVGGYKLGFEYGQKNTAAEGDFNRVSHANVVNLDESAPVQAATPAPAPDATPASAAPAAPATPAAPAAPAGEAVTYVLSTDDCFVDFTGYKTVAGDKVGMNGGFGMVEGAVSVPGGDLSQMSFTLAVKTASVFTENAILTGVMKTSAFFDVEKYPEAKLESRKVELRDGKYVATVAWTMRDKTVGVELPMDVKQTANGLTAVGEVFIDRNQWGVGYADYEGIPILPEVRVKFEMLAKKK